MMNFFKVMIISENGFSSWANLSFLALHEWEVDDGNNKKRR